MQQEQKGTQGETGGARGASGFMIEMQSIANKQLFLISIN